MLIDPIDCFYVSIDSFYVTIQQWRYTLAVIDHGSFSRAADACHVSQPTLSSQIAKLEDELGIVLLDRLSRPVRESPQANPLIERARTAIQSLSALPAMAADRGSALTGRLRVGIIPTLSQYLLPLFLREFIDEHPGLRVEVSELQSARVLDGLRDFALDLGILVPPARLDGLESRTLFHEKFLVYLPPGGKRAGQIELRGLDQGEMLLLTEGHCLRDQIIDLCGQNDSDRKSRVAFATGSLESLIALVDQELGFTLLPELVTPTLTGEQRGRCHEIAPKPPVREIAMVYHPAFVRPALLESAAQAILGNLPTEVRANGSGSAVFWYPR